MTSVVICGRVSHALVRVPTCIYVHTFGSDMDLDPRWAQIGTQTISNRVAGLSEPPGRYVSIANCKAVGKEGTSIGS